MRPTSVTTHQKRRSMARNVNHRQPVTTASANPAPMETYRYGVCTGNGAELIPLEPLHDGSPRG